jgi:hypothetical protein
MTTTLNWPARVPLPAIAGYGLKPKPNFDRTEVETGPARQRKRSTTTLDQLAVQFELTAWEMAILDGWLEERAGAGWWLMPLLSGRGIEAWEVRVMGGLEREDNPRNGALWTCRLTLEARGRPRVSGDDLDLLLTEDMSAIFDAILGLHNVIHYDLST